MPFVRDTEGHNHYRPGNRDKNWFRLDNAGKVYPAILSLRRTSLFRISATLNERVHAGDLQRALDETIIRFPYFNVQIKAGLFWYFLETNEHSPIVEQDSQFPCMAMNVKKERMHLFRVRAFHKKVSVEFSHILTDGTGALIFLKTLLYTYFIMRGMEKPEEADLQIFNLTEKPNQNEYEDSFKQVYNKRLPFNRRQNRAFHLPQLLDWPGRYNIITGIISIDDLKKRCRKKNVSLTEFLTAVLIDSFQDYCREYVSPGRHKPIVINIPVNLRPIFNTTTMKNFFIPLEPSIDPRLGHYTFDEVLKKVHHYMRHEVDDKVLNQQITRNVKGEMNAFVRTLPLVIKNILLPIIYNILGENNYTCGLSNLGSINMPGVMNELVERFEFIPAPSTGLKSKIGIVSHKDKMYITFGRLIREAPIEKIFFRKLRKSGIRIKIESN